MADVSLTLRRGYGSFFLVGTELTYDTTPPFTDITEGGAIDFDPRPTGEKNMLAANSDAGTDPIGSRTFVVLPSPYYTV